MTAAAPAVLRIGWRRHWMPPHVRRRLLAGLLAAAGVLLALSSLHRPVARLAVRAPAVTGVVGLAAGLVAAPVRLADAGVAPLLHRGMWVDVLSAGSLSDTGAAAAEAGVVAPDVQVLSVESAQSGSAAADNDAGGTLVLLAVTRADALALAQGEASGRLSVTLLGG